jgi:hypothetical protein
MMMLRERSLGSGCMRWLLGCAALLVTAAAAAADPVDLEAKGLISVTAFGAVADDGKDDTAAIQRAVDEARRRGLVAFFPSGVFHLSDTISVVQETLWNEKRQQWIHQRAKPNMLLGTTSGERPVLRLIDDSPGFDDPSNPKPLVWVWSEPRNHMVTGKKRNLENPRPEDEQSNISFDQVFRGIDIDIRAAGNSGAVGIRHAGSQGSMLEDVTVWAKGGFAGILNLPGQGGGTYDITVHGGRYGVIGERRTRFPVVAGVRLLDQEEANLRWQGQSNISVVGFHFRMAKPGPAVLLNQCNQTHNCAVTLVDGVIELADGPGERTAIDDSQSGNLYLENVALRQADSIHKAESGRLPTGRDWSLVTQYAYGARGRGMTYIDGQKTDGVAVLAPDGGSQPDIDSLLAKHLSRQPSFEDEDAVDATRFGAIPDDGKDDTDAILKAFERSDHVFLPKGVYTISRTLTLPRQGHLFGVAKHLSVLQADPTWRPKGGTPMISTVDDPDASPMLSTLRIELANNQNHTPIVWRAGRNSVVRDIIVGLPRSGPSAPVRQINADRQATFLVERNGGGRWYGATGEWTVLRFAASGEQYRHFRVENTTEPLVAYALNVERSLSEPQVTFKNASDVTVYYLKCEPQKERGNRILEILDSRDVSVYGYSGINNRNDGALFEIRNSSDVTIVNILPLNPSGKLVLLDDQLSADSRVTVTGPDPVVLYRR